MFDGRYAGDAIADLELACEKRGRNFDEISVALMNPPQDRAGLEQRMRCGFRNFIFMVTVDTASAVERSLDELARLKETLDGVD